MKASRCCAKTTDNGQRTTVGGGSRLWLRGATLRLKTKVVRQKEGGSRPFAFCLSSFVLCLSTKNFTTLQQHYILRTTDNRQRTTEGGSRPFVLCLSSFVCKAQNIITLLHYIFRTTDNGQQTTDRAVAGIMELRSHGITEIGLMFKA